MTEHCARCGKTKDEHHAFELFTPVDGCLCDSHVWAILHGLTFPDVCGPDWEAPARALPWQADACGKCGHAKRCHR